MRRVAFALLLISVLVEDVDEWCEYCECVWQIINLIYLFTSISPCLFVFVKTN